MKKKYRVFKIQSKYTFEESGYVYRNYYQYFIVIKGQKEIFLMLAPRLYSENEVEKIIDEQMEYAKARLLRLQGS